MQQVQIKLIKTPPVSKAHGCTEGRVFDVLRFEDGAHNKFSHNPVWIIGDQNEEVKIFSHEYEIVEVAQENHG